jgi:hypothetical protein
MNTFSVEKAVVIRYPSTANLMVDSADRNQTLFPLAGNFQITKPNSIANGYFTRAGTTEVVLEWCEPNMGGVVADQTLTFDLSGTSVRSSVPVSYLEQFFTVADLLNAVCLDLSGVNGINLSVNQTINPGFTSLRATGGRFRVFPSALATRLGIDTSATLATFKSIIGCPDLRLYRYLDITSSELTYAQNLKDTTTATYPRDVLCRWYFAEDSQEARDEYGFPILQGYESFVRRRIFNPPKQIKWDSNLPIGNLSFTVYDEDGDLLPMGDSNFLLTIQLSEN